VRATQNKQNYALKASAPQHITQIITSAHHQIITSSNHHINLFSSAPAFTSADPRK